MFCPNCGASMEGSSCSYCGYTNTPAPAAAPVSTNTQPAVELKKPENVLLGSVGALIGAAIGGAGVVLLLQMNYIATICGLLMAFLALKGYELLAKQEPGTLGKIICLVIIAIIPFIAYRLGLAIDLIREFKDYGISYSLGDANEMISSLLEYDEEFKGDYIKDLVMLYLFTALGAGGTIVGMFKKK